ncbi:uncharacterized protein TRUGW13939_09081 [Talaromyces rugulosus]|uniref:NodB homology domain-containing protein n=1 Tax=Talaromyces rugulosus TaxID=121627 RepID=A0A7H8R8G7_TALRU|nr:uncharacterized protein TRUGW13939_09081 [Talaromyces rugulosus]QKX61925.1 hypothetical protein TRUGW13939_09081 [Talaromyces rugulosus]
MDQTAYLAISGRHVFITGAAGSIGSQAVREFLDQGCNVTAHDLSPVQLQTSETDRLHTVTGDISDEDSIKSCMEQAQQRFGPIDILIANAGIADESQAYPIWDLPVDIWDKNYRTNARGTFLTIKHFLRAAKSAQENQGGRELDNLAIVITGSEYTKEAGYSDYASGKAGLQYGLIQGLKNETVRLNRKARVNAVAYGPENVARAMAFLASHRVAGHISGQCISVEGGIDGRLVWKENEVVNTSDLSVSSSVQMIPQSMPKPPRNKIRVAVSIDLDAVSGWLGTGYSPDNVLADYSAGFFAARVGVPRLLNMLKRVGIANKVTWFIPGHSAESFPQEVQQVVESGCEVGLHGYAHEGAYSLTVQQERDILEKCIEIATKITGKRPVGYHASLTDHDCHPFFAPRRPPLQPIDYTKPASSWMHPIPSSSSLDQNISSDCRPLVEVPCNYYMEDMTPMQFLPHVHNSQGYVDVRVIEQMWRDRFLWIREHESEPIFAMLMHPDTSGMAHVIGMVERMIRWLQSWGEDEVEFMQTGEIARWWKEENLRK